MRVTASVKSVGLFAATFATYATGADVHPGLAVLAQVAGYSERATGIALDAVCRLGFMWRYVNGSQAGRPGSGRRPVASAYRLTVPDDILSGRVPLLGGEDPISDQVMPDQLISVPGSPELSDRITRSQFAPPIQDPVTHPDITVVDLTATSVEGRRAGLDQPNSDQVLSVREILGGGQDGFEDHRQQTIETFAAWMREHPEGIVKDGSMPNGPRRTGAAGITNGAEAVRTALRAADWRAYAAANGLSGDWRRARRYGLSPKELHALYLEQGGCCYLCGDPLPKNLTRAVVEHDHTCCPGPAAVASGYKTSCGKCVRGISCSPCNQVIASAQDDPGRLRRIADNLETANRRVGRPKRIAGTSANARRADTPAQHDQLKQEAAP